MKIRPKPLNFRRRGGPTKINTLTCVGQVGRRKLSKNYLKRKKIMPLWQMEDGRQ
jgi:hypothetical protein